MALPTRSSLPYFSELGNALGYSITIITRIAVACLVRWFAVKLEM